MLNLPTMRHPRYFYPKEEQAAGEEMIRVIARALGAGEEEPAAPAPNSPAPLGPPPVSHDAQPFARQRAPGPVMKPGPVMRVNDPAAAAPAVQSGEMPAGWSPLGVLTEQLPPANPNYNAPLTPGAPRQATAGPVMRDDRAGPVVTGAERRALGPLPVMRDDKGESITRPEYDDTGDERTDLTNYERSLQMFRNPKDRDGRGWSTLKRAALGFAQGVGQTGSLAGGLGGAITGGVYGAVRPNWNERVERDAEQARVGARLKTIDERTASALDIEGARESNRLKSAQADYYRDVKPVNDAALREDREKRALLGQLGKMGAIDPAKHKTFLDEWQRLHGEPFDVEGFNNKKSNFVVRGFITDPSKPQEKHDVAINFVTGEVKDLGLSGFVIPRDEKGMSEGERRTDDDRDRAFDATERHRSATLGLSTERLREQMLNGLNSRARGEFTTATQGLFERRSKLESQISDLQKRADSLTVDPADARRRVADLERERDGITSQIDAERGKALGAMSATPQPLPRMRDPSTSPGRPAAPSSPAPAGRVSRRNFDKVRAQNPSLQGKSDAEVEAALRAQGIEVY